MKSPRLFVLVCGLGCFLQTTLAQTKVSTPLPRYQFHLNLGSSQNADGVSETSEKMPFIGLGFTYSPWRFLYVSADVQMMSENFDMASHRQTPINASPETPLEMPSLRYRTSDLNTKPQNYQLLPAQLIRLTSMTGVHRHQHYNFNIGYQRVFPRNILRIGAGVSYWRSYSRNIASKGYPLYTYSNDLTYLLLRDIRAFEPNLQASYDFFLLKNLSVGVRGDVMLVKGWGPTNSQLGITLGYAPSSAFYAKKKPLKGV